MIRNLLLKPRLNQILTMTDANAIRVLTDYGTGFKHVGCIAEELTKYAHHVTH